MRGEGGGMEDRRLGFSRNVSTQIEVIYYIIL